MLQIFFKIIYLIYLKTAVISLIISTLYITSNFQLLSMKLDKNGECSIILRKAKNRKPSIKRRVITDKKLLIYCIYTKKYIYLHVKNKLNNLP